MPTKVTPFAATPDPTFGQPSTSGAPDDRATVERPSAAAAAVDLRLVIEQVSGTYVYKTINCRTGEVVQQLPREEVLRLRESLGYTAGELIRTKA